MALGPDALDGKGRGATDPGVPFLITPHDSNDLAFVTRMITVATGGTLTVDAKLPDGTIVTSGTLTVPAGSFPWRITRVYATGTAATGITGTR